MSKRFAIALLLVAACVLPVSLEAQTEWTPPHPQEVRWVNKNLMTIQRSPGYEVWASLQQIPKEVSGKGQEFRVFLAISNLSSETIRVSPLDVRLEKVKEKRNGLVLDPLPIWKPGEYARELDSRIRTRQVLMALAAAGTSTPQQSTVQMNAYDAWGRHTGSVTGTVTTPPSSYEQYQHQKAILQDAAAIQESMARSKEQVLASLLRPTTVPPRSYVSGTVYFYRWRGDHYRLTVPVAGTEFEFDFRMTTPEEFEEMNPEEGVAHPLEE